MSSWFALCFSTTTMARQLCDISGPLLLIADFRWTGSRYAFSCGSGNFGVGLCIRGYNWGTAYPLRRQNRELVIVFGCRSTWQAIISNVLGPQHMCTPCTWAVCPFPSPIEYNLCYIRQRLSLQAMRCDTPPTRRMRNARLICGALRCVDASGLFDGPTFVPGMMMMWLLLSEILILCWPRFASFFRAFRLHFVAFAG